MIIDTVKAKEEIIKNLQKIEKTIPLNGLHGERIDCFIAQLIHSLRRTHYIEAIKKRNLSPERMDPRNENFDPLKASIIHLENKNFNESIWLIYLSTFFGKNIDSGWNLVRLVYLGPNSVWTFENIKNNFNSFKEWYENTWNKISETNSIKNKFGNHRKYSTLDPLKNNNPIECFEDYLHKVGENHINLLNYIETNSENKKLSKFSLSYEFSEFKSFGRMSKFDFSSMLCKIGIIESEIDKAFINDSTGPLKGLKDLLGNQNIKPKEADLIFDTINDVLGLGKFRGQVLEDAICNWQKSPNKFKKFSL
jgi:hypothetical protein